MDKSLQKFAIQIVKEAGELTLSRFGKIKPTDISYKRSGQRSPVTDVDLQINKFLSDKIQSKYPTHSIMSEESKLVIGKKITWVIDPIDGTNNYLNGKKNYSITIAVIENNKIVFGIIYLPSLKNIYHVIKGGGVFKNGKMFKIDKNKDKAFKIFGFPNIVNKQKKFLGNSEFNLILPNRCVTKDLVDITEGIVDGVFYKNVHLWDYAAGVLMVDEVGGKILNFSGKPYNIKSRNLVVLGKRLVKK